VPTVKSVTTVEHARRRLLANCDADELRSIADRALSLPHFAERLLIVTPPEIGTAIAAHQLGGAWRSSRHVPEIMVTRAEVTFGRTRGSAVRVGTDRATALAAAICDVLVASHEVALGELAVQVRVLCDRTRSIIDRFDLVAWADLASTAVAFERVE
jgi:alpha-D-ribose 1-methylphosphonate 5-triphosphate synthase subunit PhnG